MNDVSSELASMLLPEEIRLHFSLSSIREEPHGIVLGLEEYAELVPSALDGVSNVVLDGFCNPVELLHYSIQDRPLYLRIYRLMRNSPCLLHSPVYPNIKLQR
jgi:hypothetical protein